jgi:hypothetical protein
VFADRHPQPDLLSTTTQRGCQASSRCVVQTPAGENHRHVTTLGVGLAIALIAAACSGPSRDVASKAPSSSAVPVPTPPAVVTPIIASVLATRVAVSATDGKMQIAYELMLTNTMLSPKTIHSIKATADGRTIFDLSEHKLSTWMKGLGTKSPSTVLGPGQAAVVLIDATVDNFADVPVEIRHAKSGI